MAQKTDAQLGVLSQQVADETAPGANTADRVGTLFQDFVDSKINNAVIDTTVTLAANSDSKIPSQKAVKTYVDARTPSWYAANLTQFSTIAPAEDTLFSSLPLGAIVWARSSAGIYTGTLAGQFLAGKVPYISGVIYDATTAASIRGYFIVRTNDNVITLTTTIDGTPSDGVLQGEFIQIPVYP